MDDSFSAQGARDPRGIVLRILQFIRPVLITELCGGGSTRGMDGWGAGGGVLAAEELDDMVSTKEGGKPEPMHRLATGPWALMLLSRRMGKTRLQDEQGAAMVLVGDDIS